MMRYFTPQNLLIAGAIYWLFLRKKSTGLEYLQYGNDRRGGYEVDGPIRSVGMEGYP